MLSAYLNIFQAEWFLIIGAILIILIVLKIIKRILAIISSFIFILTLLVKFGYWF